MGTLAFVFDTNTILSAVLSRQSVPRLAFDHAFSIGKILQSTETIAELNEVMQRSKFDKYIDKQDRLEFLGTVIRDAEIIVPEVTINACRDPKDNKFLELAMSGNAFCIVSGDNDLLEMHPFRKIAIYSPRTFLDLLQA